jgi:carbonic anhydrase/acetyltransferase-like protein (isoleucine patch superfamily)
VVGMGATMLQRSRLGAGSMLAAGAVLGEGQAVPPGHLAAGVLATVKKPLDGSSRSWVGTAAQHYRDRAVRYRAKLRTADQ